MEKQKNECGLQALYAKLPEVLLPWYRANARDLPWRHDHEPYHVWVSEIMLQQTRAEVVSGYFVRFLEKLPTLAALANAEEDVLLKLWEGLGYYTRVRNLQKAARKIMEEHGGVFPDTPQEIRALPGVGPYTAGAIGSICFNLPTAAVDGNVLRIAARITENAAPIDLPATRQEIAEALEEVYPRAACGDFTQALMELGATVCTPKSPKCGSCPAADFCRARAHDSVMAYPVRLPKKAKREEEKTVFVLFCGDEIALCRREEGGLLSGLWQLPNMACALDSASALERIAAQGLKPVELLWELHRTHIFTHIRWEMTCYGIRCAEPHPDYIWVSRDEIGARYALPTAFRMFLEDPILDTV